jgi:hypothetical protein
VYQVELLLPNSRAAREGGPHWTAAAIQPLPSSSAAGSGAEHLQGSSSLPTFLPSQHVLRDDGIADGKRRPPAGSGKHLAAHLPSLKRTLSGDEEPKDSLQFSMDIDEEYSTSAKTSAAAALAPQKSPSHQPSGAPKVDLPARARSLSAGSRREDPLSRAEKKPRRSGGCVHQQPLACGRWLSVAH